MNTDFVPWPADYSARYRAAGLWRDRPLGHWMWQWAEAYGDRVALVDGDHQCTYRELAEQADLLAESLAALGLSGGERVLVQLPNSWEFIALMLACFRAGVAPVLALPAHREHDLTQLARTAKVKALFVPDTLRGFEHQAVAARVAAGQHSACPVVVVGGDVRQGHVDFRELIERDGDVPGRRARLDAVAPPPDAVALFLLSGGTTGVPKMIARTHNDYDYNVRRSAEVCEFGPDTVFMVTLPIAHNFPLGCPGVLGTLANGGRVIVLRSPEPVTAFRAIAEHCVTVTALVPAVAQRWAEAAEQVRPDLASLRLVQVGGSVLDPTLARRIRDVLRAHLQQVFGMAEGLLSYTRLGDPEPVLLATQGRPICAHDELRIVDEHDRPVPRGEQGELLTRGPYTTRGYFRAAEQNALSFTAEGWYRTGDLVRMHPSGNLVVEGRRKDLVNRGGEKVSAEEVEILARELLPVADAVIVPVADERLGERVCLVAIPNEDGLELGEVRDRFTDRGVAHYKIPEMLWLVSEFPLTAVGKIDKKAVREAISVARKGSTT